MTTFTLRMLASLAAISCIVSEVALGQSAPNQSTIVVRLAQNDVFLFSNAVRIGQVAEVTCDNSMLAQRIKSLDLDSLTLRNNILELTSNQIKYRMLLAGIRADQLIMDGPDSIRVALQSSADILPKLAQTIAGQVSDHFSIGSTAFRLTLRPEAREVIERHVFDWNFALIESQFPEEFRSGDCLLPVFVQSGGQEFRLDLPANIQLNPNSNSQTANRLGVPPIDSNTQVRQVNYEMVVDRGGPVLRRILDDPSIDTDPQSGQPSVKANSTVRVVQTFGTVKIVLKNARAATAGSVGDVVELISPFRNASGKERRLIGRVVDEGEVELIR